MTSSESERINEARLRDHHYRSRASIVVRA
jgi:hypothetical protein